LYENSGKHDWLQTGEMIQVGLAWRIIDAPIAGDSPANEGGSSPSDPALQALLEELRQLDVTAPTSQVGVPGPNPPVASYNLRRADVLQKIIAKVKPEEKEQWVRQVADCLGAAAQTSPETDKNAYERLLDLEKQITTNQPGSALAGYVTFREMSADYAVKIAGRSGAEFAKVQEPWLARLGRFVQDYPQAEDTPDALMQLGMVNEFLGKEIDAKNWYQKLAGITDKKALADKAAGALRRLELEGKVLDLAGSTLAGESFNIAKLRGKVVMVYFWASYNQQSVGDFARLKLLLSNYGTKGLDLVCINLDTNPPEANSAQDRGSLPGVQLYSPNGLDSLLATQFGIMVLPNMFLVDRDGKVTSRNAQIATVEDDIKRLLK
jgi:hypothetical protein